MQKLNEKVEKSVDLKVEDLEMHLRTTHQPKKQKIAVSEAYLLDMVDNF